MAKLQSNLACMLATSLISKAQFTIKPIQKFLKSWKSAEESSGRRSERMFSVTYRELPYIQYSNIGLEVKQATWLNQAMNSLLSELRLLRPKEQSFGF